MEKKSLYHLAANYISGLLATLAKAHPSVTNTISFSQNVNFPIHAIYEVVADVESYPKILSYVKKSRIYNQTQDVLQVELVVRYGPISFAYKNDVFLSPETHDSIYVVATEGPFSTMRVNWNFFKITDGSTHVKYKLEYKFHNPFLSKAVSLLIKKNIHNTIKAFEESLAEKY